MNELEVFAKMTLEKGGMWALLEESDTLKLYKTQSTFLVKNNYHYDTPVFQVFDIAGKRKFASTSYDAALTFFRKGKGE